MPGHEQRVKATGDRVMIFYVVLGLYIFENDFIYNYSQYQIPRRRNSPQIIGDYAFDQVVLILSVV